LGDGGVPGARLEQSALGWRLADQADGGFVVQRREGSAWASSAEFPWKACE
jgi:hypothetical protein